MLTSADRRNECTVQESIYSVNPYYENFKSCDCMQTEFEQLATGWTVRGSNPGGGEIFHTCPDQPWGPPCLLYNGYQLFP